MIFHPKNHALDHPHYEIGSPLPKNQEKKHMMGLERVSNRGVMREYEEIRWMSRIMITTYL